ncbi:hypothetical protein CsSME_00004966 [Camellia sinensis var. sinensis]|uniref:Small ribosomal subunit protein mS38 n=1 Tax=Camellia sinensis var. sinensis TaxID=542762 RepID=A0A4S4D405_CAMSN|nr:uncharacterized protein LOC114316303 [Camellia sinensis]THF97059.1 hypothetical protein TEA_020483 [Camellia sinensis var. sinensis]
MASLLQKLLRNQSPNTIIYTFNKPQLQNLIPTLLTHLHHEPHLGETRPHHPCNVDPSKTGDSNPPHSTPIFPSFPIGFSLNPIISTGFVPSDGGDVVYDDATTIWADSVKKKRKRKMNKHKYKKLRKRLRKRT